MEDLIYTLKLKLDWKLAAEISKVDRFDASWIAIAKKEGQTLKQLRSIATVRSVGASTRIEGSKMSDEEVEVLISKLSVSKLKERDAQEVAGYFEAMDTISENYPNIEITESSIKNLHNILCKHNEKDAWHRGDYKKHSNVIEATSPTGEKQLIFQTTDPGIATADAMRHLIAWYNADLETHSVIKAALFVYDFLSIHPFQDGNGRLSRLLGTLLLLKDGYTWIQYVSFEHEIEHRKSEYYKQLMQAQRQRPGEDVYPWAMFFLDCLLTISGHLLEKLNVHGDIAQLVPREKAIYTFIENRPGSKSGDIAAKIAVPLPTVKRILNALVKLKLITKQGTGPGTSYSL
jgi:Fic family protein